ncbi:MAG TPA: hypothetical protein ENH94_02150 [Phycisphaerales bacterium]|nr:hypothetical protein [Phycisphaerales bacterium]
MNEKKRKTLYLPAFVCEELDVEGEKYDGPGVVASAAINAFCTMPDAEKKIVLQNYRAKEIEFAYADEVDDIVSEAEAAAEKQKQGQRPSKSA